MKRILFSIAFSSLLFMFAFSGVLAAPLEFFATVTGKTPDGATTILSVQVADAIDIDVAVTSVTELKDLNGDPITIDEVAVGSTVAVEAIYTQGGFVALEIQLQETAGDFEIKGFVESIDPAGSTLVVQGFEIVVDAQTEIKDADRELISLEDLSDLLAGASTGLPVKVEGFYEDGDLVASSIKVFWQLRFARINLEGIIAEFVNPDEFLLDIGGGTQVLVKLTTETVISKDQELVAGLSVKVNGVIGPDLAVLARRIRVVGLFELSPDELKMPIGDTREVTVVLRQALDSDLDLEIASANEEVAVVSPAQLTIPAGELSGVFSVEGVADGKTSVEVTAGEAFGSFSRRLRVEVGEAAPGNDQVELQWTPGVVRGVPHGFARVRLMLKRGVAPADLEIPLVLEDASDDLLLTFPPVVTIPEGGKSVVVDLIFGAQQGNGTLVATLPEDLGGDVAELDIDIRSNSQSNLKLRWDENRVEVNAGEEFEVLLILSEVAAQDVEVVITPVGVDRGALASFPAGVTISAGQQSVLVPFVAGENGRAKLRAALSREQGGDHADLEIRVSE